jgi:hypothetical protein
MARNRVAGETRRIGRSPGALAAAGLGLDGRRVEQTEGSGVQLLAKPGGIAVRLTDSDGRVKELKP